MTDVDYAARFAALSVARQRALFLLLYELAETTDDERVRLSFIFDALAKNARDGGDEKDARAFTAVRTLIQTLRLTD